MNDKEFRDTPLVRTLRAAVEVGFIIFLFYTNLLMGEYTRTNSLPGKTLSTAISNIFTLTNFLIGFTAGLVGHLVFQFLRKKFK